MSSRIARRMAQAAKSSDLMASSSSSVSSASIPAGEYTYRLKKVWPPELHKLSAQEQLRFEKRYKRRVQHITARPRWNKMVGLAQLFTISFVVVYSVLFMDWKTQKQPFDGIRAQMWEMLGYGPAEKKTVEARK
ncbi:hypothetical protein B0T22DRAFT_246394 [Podospora appendiculata]|uniref:Uncharacterized protein n=1 Tax=Podospora appendiculata TaxID=314037 RepID=A0AAE1C8T6_9PEZI|nr:hypothetical protein B0T22DRAFT_246394 [Podospora appendiculata]